MPAEREETSAGGVVYRRVEGVIEVTVGRQRDRLTGRETLRLPKGNVEPGETPEQAAVREVHEEAGLDVRIVSPLETAAYSYQEGATRVAKRVHYFLMEPVTPSDGEAGEPFARDGELLEAAWCEIERAIRTLSFDNERNAVRGALARLR